MKSVSTRLMLLMLLISALGMGLIAVIGTALSGTALLDLSLGRISESTALNAKSIDSWIGDQSRYISAIAVDFSTLPYVDSHTVLPALVEHTESNDEYFAVYVGYPDGIGVFNDGWIPDYTEWRANERGWYVGAAATPDKAYVTDVYQDADTGSMCITVSHTLMRGGNIVGVVAIDIFTDVLLDVVNETVVGHESYAFLTDSQGNIMVHPNSAYAPVVDANDDMVFQNIYRVENGVYAPLGDPTVKNGKSVLISDIDGVDRYYTECIIPATGWILYTTIPANVIEEPIFRQITAAAVVFIVILLLAMVFIYLALRKLIVQPVKDVTEAANLLTKGESGIKLEHDYVGEIALLAESFRGMEAFNRQQTEWLEKIAAGDLSIEIKPRSEGDRTGIAIASMLHSLNDMFANINQSARQVASGSSQIANGAQSLAQGTTQQAASIKELSGTISEIKERTVHNASVARKAAEMSNNIKDKAEYGGNQMDQMMIAIKEINESSTQIDKVIKVIDDIAFQTNILALNAAVEAARAGQQGKGFAVVADEVRNLAAKSAVAAKDTGVLIGNSVEKANYGLGIATETTESLKEIVKGINDSAEIAAQIASASDEQAVEIAQINAGIDQVAQVIQQNSATAQESAAASMEMSRQSAVLQKLIARFKTDALEPAPDRMALPPADPFTSGFDEF